MLISVIIPTYNRYDLVNRAIDSVLKQTLTDYEIIVVDDCSPDNNYEKLKDRTDIRYFRLEQRRGLPAVVRNFGIKKSSGEWIAFLDDDDFWLPNKLTTQIEWRDRYNFICSDAYCKGRLWIGDINLNAWNQKNPTGTHQFSHSLICNHNLIINSSVLIKKEVLESVGLIPENPSFRGVEDYMTWLEVLRNNNLCFFIDEGLLEYDSLTYKHHKDDYI